MDTLILQDELGGSGRGLARTAPAVLASLLVIVALLVLTGAIGDRPGAAPGRLFSVTMVVVYAIMVVVGFVTERASDVASRGPVPKGQVYTNAPHQVVGPALMDAITRQGVQVVEWRGTTGEGRKSVSMASWGSRVFWDLRPSVDRPGLGVVTVVVRPSWPAQFSEWGKGVKLATSVLKSVPGVVAYRDPRDPAQVRPIG